MDFDVIADLPGGPIGFHDPCRVQMMPRKRQFFYGIYQARIIFRRAIQVARDKIGFHELTLAQLAGSFDAYNRRSADFSPCHYPHLARTFFRFSHTQAIGIIAVSLTRFLSRLVMTTTLRTPAQWAESQFASARLGDRRRTQRLVKMATCLAQRPSGTLPQAFPQWNELKATYRLLDHIEFGPE